MKRNLLVFGLFLSAFCSYAQTTCSSYAIPEIRTNDNLVYSDSVGINIVNSLPAGYQYVGAGTNFPNVAYIFTFEDQYIDQTQTPGNLTIIGTSEDGHFTPSQLTRYDAEVELGSRLKAVTVGYNLNNIKNLVDSLTTGRGGNGGNTPCFEILGLISPNWHTRLQSKGITTGADVNNFGDVLSVLEAINPTDASYSLDRIQERLTTLNNTASFLSNGCGASKLPICIKYNASVAHDYIVTNKTVNADLSVETTNETSFSIYPNPADKNGINIRLNSAANGIHQITCINTIGQVVTTQQFDSSNTEVIRIETNHLEKGIYFIEVTNGNQRTTQKVVVK